MMTTNSFLAEFSSRCVCAPPNFVLRSSGHHCTLSDVTIHVVHYSGVSALLSQGVVTQVYQHDGAFLSAGWEQAQLDGPTCRLVSRRSTNMDVRPKASAMSAKLSKPGTLSSFKRPANWLCIASSRPTMSFLHCVMSCSV